MNLRSIVLIARSVLLESVRRKDLWVLAIIGGLFLLSARTIGLLGSKGIEVFLKDLAVTVVGLFSTVLSILTTVRLVPEEIKQRTLYPMLCRPLSRLDFLLGKWLGAWLVSIVGLLALSACSAIALLSFGVTLEPVIFQYLFLKAIGLGLLCAVSLSASIYMTPQAAATVALLFAFGGNMISRAMTMMYANSSAAGKGLMQALNFALPQYSLFDTGSRVANLHWPPVGITVVLTLIAYGFVYSTIFLALGQRKFGRQAL